MTNIRLYQFTPKTSPVPADLVYLGDSANAFDEVASTIAQVISAYPNLSAYAALSLGNNTYAYTNSSGVLTAGTITALGVSLLADSTTSLMQTTLGYTSSPTALSFAGWDANSNLSANNFISGYATTATAASTTTLTVSSAYQQYFTGTTTQTVVMPVTSTLVLGQSYLIVNNSTGTVTVQSSGANTIKAMAANTSLLVTCISTSGTTAASWNAIYLSDTAISLPLAIASGGTGVTSVTTSPTASAWAGWDSSKNLSANNFNSGYTTTATAASTTALTASSTFQQYFTGSTTQTVTMPNPSGLVLGQSFYIVNNSTGNVSVQSYTASAIQTMAPGTSMLITCILTSGTGASSFSWIYNLNTPLTLPLSIANGGTGSSSVITSPTASRWAGWDTNKNLSANSFLPASATTATAASTTTLTVSSAFTQIFTGTTTQTVVLPATNTLVVGQGFYIINQSTGVVTVEASDATTIQAMAAGTVMYVIANTTSSTTNTSWSALYYNPSGGSSPWTAGSGTGSAYGGAAGTAAASSYSLAWGNGSTNTGTSGNNNFAFGNGCTIGNSTTYSFVFGRNSAVTGNSYSLCFGNAGTAGGSFSLAFGNVATANNDYAIAIGHAPTVSNDGSVVWGDSNSTPVPDSTANQFNLTFAAGFRFYQNNTPTLLASFLPAGSSIIGTNTNNNASTGYVGEFVSSQVLAGSGVSLTTVTSKDITMISLSAGDWDVVGNTVLEGSSDIINIARSWISTTSATLPDNSLTSFQEVVTGFGNWGVPVPPVRLSLSTTTTVYLSTQATFPSGTVSASGGIFARRVR